MLIPGANKVAVVTGANRGIGYFTALQLAWSGMYRHVILGCRNLPEGLEAAESIQNLISRPEATQISCLPLVVGNPSSHSQFIDELEDLLYSDIPDEMNQYLGSGYGNGYGNGYGYDRYSSGAYNADDRIKVDLLVNNAAIAFKHDDITPFDEQTKPTLDVNFRGTVDLTQQMMPLLRKAGRQAAIRPMMMMNHDQHERFRTGARTPSNLSLPPPSEDVDGNGNGNGFEYQYEYTNGGYPPLMTAAEPVEIIDDDDEQLQQTKEVDALWIPQPARIINVASRAGRLDIVDPYWQEQLTNPDLTMNELFEIVDTFEEDVLEGTHLEKGWPMSNYGMSKLALIAATKVWAKEEFMNNICVQAVCPGSVTTEMSSGQGVRSPEEGASEVVRASLLDSHIISSSSSSIHQHPLDDTQPMLRSTGSFLVDGIPQEW